MRPRVSWTWRAAGASLLTNASPNKELRDVGDEVSQKVAAQATALSLNVDVYQALKAIDASGLGTTDADRRRATT